MKYYNKPEYHYNRIFHVRTPLFDLTSHFLSEYILNNTIIPGTIVIFYVWVYPRNLGQNPLQTKPPADKTYCIVNNKYVQCTCVIINTFSVIYM